MEKEDSYVTQKRIKRENRLRILQLLDKEPKRFTDLLNETKFSPAGLTKILGDMVKARQIGRTLLDNGKQAYKMTQKGRMSITDFANVGRQIERMRERGAKYHIDYSSYRGYTDGFCGIPWGIQDDIIIDNIVDEKSNPITKELAWELNEQIFKKTSEWVHENHYNYKSIEGKIILSFIIDCKTLWESIRIDSPRLRESITEQELDAMERIEREKAAEADFLTRKEVSDRIEKVRKQAADLVHIYRK